MAPQKTDLDAEALESLLTRLDRDSGEAGKKYLQLRDKLARHCFKKHEFLRADELADQTLNVLAKKLSSKEEHIDKPEPYAFTILDNLLLANIRGRKMVLLPENFPGGDNPEGTVIEKMDGEKKFKCVLQCLDRLSPEESWLFFAYNPLEECNREEIRRQIASELGITVEALRTRMNRLKAKMAKCFKNCISRGRKRPPSGSNGNNG
jgi:DNA-directed RNA polymerase specialized sigma24 family protein